MFSYESVRPAAGVPLQAHVEELRRRCEAVARVQGGHPSYLEEVTIFRRYAVECDLFFRQALPELARPPDDEGNEHQVWFRRETNAYVKVTWPDVFGLLVLYRPDEDERASPIAYLERWCLHNDLFGDAVIFIGVLEDDGSCDW